MMRETKKGAGCPSKNVVLPVLSSYIKYYMRIISLIFLANLKVCSINVYYQPMGSTVIRRLCSFWGKMAK